MSSRYSLRISLKLKIDRQDDPPSPSPPLAKLKETKKAKTNAEACRAYREKMKQDPEKYEAYLNKQKEQSKRYRAESCEEKKARQREQARLRMKAMRERQREQAGPATRASQEEKRAKWREEKKSQAAKMTPQRRRRVNERRREKYHERKMMEISSTSNLLQLAVTNAKSPASNVTTPAAKRKALSRARAAMPKSPRKYAEVLVGLHVQASPKKKAVLQTKGFGVSPHLSKIGAQVEKMVEQIKTSRSKTCNTTRRIILDVYREAYKSGCAIPKKAFRRKALLKEAGQKLKKERKLEKEIKQFYESAAVTLPSKKYISKKTGIPTAVLRKPLHELYQEFQRTSEESVSFGHFALCRPVHIRSARQNVLRQCLCEYCENAKLKINTINRVAARYNNNCRIRHAYHAVDLVTCGRMEGKWQYKCTARTCISCQSGSALDNHLAPLLHHEEDVKWHEWQSRLVVVNGKKVFRKALVEIQGTMADLKDQLKEEVIFLASHLFRADWQYKQFDLLRHQSPFPEGTVLMVLDFAENFTCTHQDEVQAAHWHHEQVTIHPIVTFYRCRVCQEAVTESLVFLSDDKQHDYHAVHRFTALAHQHLQQVRLVSVKHIMQFTDGCAAQYKSKGPFADISCALEDYHCTFERHFFGSRHGKGPSDGESAVVKSAATRAIKAGDAVISSPEELFNYCNTSALNKQPEGAGCNHSLRTFFYVAQTEINRKRERSVATLKGTRSLHVVKCVANHVLLTRALSCACQACQSGTGKCINMDIVGPWTRKALKTTVPRPSPASAQLPAPVSAQLPAPVSAQLPAPVSAQLPAPVSAKLPAPVSSQLPAPVSSQLPAPVSAQLPAPVSTRLPSPASTQLPAPPPPLDSEAAPQHSPHQLSAEDFVIVAVKGKLRTINFYVKVLEIDGAELKVHYLVSKTGKDTYTWADTAWIVHDDVVKKVPPPVLVPGRGIAFSFQ